MAAIAQPNPAGPAAVQPAAFPGAIPGAGVRPAGAPAPAVPGARVAVPPAADYVVELNLMLNARVKLELLSQKYCTDVDAKQKQALGNLANAQTLSDFATQMDAIEQTDRDLRSALTKKSSEADWLEDHGVRLIENYPQAAEILEEQLEGVVQQQDQPNRSQLRLLEAWERQASASGRAKAVGKATTRKQAKPKAQPRKKSMKTP